jgi:hypothetical protein
VVEKNFPVHDTGMAWIMVSPTFGNKAMANGEIRLIDTLFSPGEGRATAQDSKRPRAAHQPDVNDEIELQIELGRALVAA